MNKNSAVQELFGHHKENTPNRCLLSHYSLIYSYSKNPKTPICITRYTHEHTFSTHTSTPRRNPWCSIYIFISGKCTFLLENNIYTLCPGNAIVINDLEEYRSQFQRTPLVDYYEINFPRSFFDEIATPNIFAEMFYDRENSERNFISLNETLRSELLNKLRKAEISSKKSEPASDFLSYSYLIQAIEILYSAFSDISTEKSNRQPPHKLTEAVNYIYEHFLTISTVSEISSACGISSTYLQRIFKKFFSETPTSYINELRISHAKSLIQKGESLTSACYNSGFSDYTYFSSKFKTLTTLSPSQYRNEIQKLP